MKRRIEKLICNILDTHYDPEYFLNNKEYLIYENSYLFKNGLVIIKDIFIKIYYKCNCKCKSCYKTNDVIVIDKIDKV